MGLRDLLAEAAALYPEYRNNGVVQSHSALVDTPNVTSLLATLHERQCEYWSEDRKKYFDWHAASRGR